MARDIGEWLEQLGLGEYAEAQSANGSNNWASANTLRHSPKTESSLTIWPALVRTI